MVCCILVLLVAYLLWHTRKTFISERFTTISEKKEAIKKWFAANPRPTYLQFRRALDGVNIVDYEEGRLAARR